MTCRLRSSRTIATIRPLRANNSGGSFAACKAARTSLDISWSCRAPIQISRTAPVDAESSVGCFAAGEVRFFLGRKTRVVCSIAVWIVRSR